MGGRHTKAPANASRDMGIVSWAACKTHTAQIATHPQSSSYEVAKEREQPQVAVTLTAAPTHTCRHAMIPNKNKRRTYALKIISTALCLPLR